MWNILGQFDIVKLAHFSFKKGLLHYTIISSGKHTRQFEQVIIGYNRVMLLYEEMVKNYPIKDPKIDLLLTCRSENSGNKTDSTECFSK